MSQSKFQKCPGQKQLFGNFRNFGIGISSILPKVSQVKLTLFPMGYIWPWFLTQHKYR